MTTNELLTLVLSVAALGFSLITYFIGRKQEAKQQRASVREGLSSVVQELITVQGELQVLSAEPPPARGPTYAQKLGSLNHRLTSLARQAAELDRMELDVSFDVELAAIALALESAGDIPASEIYFRRAIKKSPSPYYRAINWGMLARSLFNQFRLEPARKAYAEALSALPNTSDFNRSVNVRTLFSWYSSEAWHRNPPGGSAADLLAQARALAATIEHVPMRESVQRQFESDVAETTAQIKIADDYFHGAPPEPGFTRGRGSVISPGLSGHPFGPGTPPRPQATEGG